MADGEGKLNTLAGSIKWLMVGLFLVLLLYIGVNQVKWWLERKFREKVN